MAELAFVDEFRLFDGTCVRFHGRDGATTVPCGVTAEALKQRDPRLPSNGLIPAEQFIAAYERLMVEIHDAARAKYAAGALEREGEIRVIVRRHDLLA
jgi:uncharacterized protein DUF1488